MTMTSGSEAIRRATPHQARSVTRVNTLLDAAASLINEGGSTAATITAISKVSGSSIGVIYRYFPNLTAILGALAARNAERYIERFTRALPDTGDDWAALSNSAIDVFVDMMRTEPGFPHVLFDQFRSMRATDSTFSEPSNVLAQLYAGMLESRYHQPVDEALMFALETAAEIAEGLLTRAFRFDPHGDERFITRSRELVLAELTAA